MATMVMNADLPSNRMGTVNGEKEVNSVTTANKDDSNIPDIIEEKRKGIDGRVTVNKFMKGRMLGKGGFAKVFLGISLPSKTQYALKIVAKSSLTKTRAKQKLQTEIKIHRALRHIHIVRFDRFFEDNDNAYMILELCNNNSMSELLKKRKKLSEAEARYYISQIVSCLQFLHENLVIHRDLKLGNLFIDGDMRIKVGDFGLATKLTNKDERRKTVCGTPNYIAPEILEGKDGHSFEVDIWSTGVILYTFLIGKPPFESKDVKSTYKRILSNSYAFPDHTPICSNAKKLITHLLQARPENRPSLDAIISHPFFTAFTPTTIPDSTLRECPTLQQLTEFENNNKKAAAAATVDFNQRHFVDENDPSLVNKASRPFYSTESNKLLAPKLVDNYTEPSSNVLKPKNMNSLPVSQSKSIETEIVLAKTSNVQPTARVSVRASSAISNNIQPNIPTERVSIRASSNNSNNIQSNNPTTRVSVRASSVNSNISNLSEKGSSVVSGVTTSSAVTNNNRPVSRSHNSNNTGYTQKFDIFVESKNQNNRNTTNSVNTANKKYDNMFEDNKSVPPYDFSTREIANKVPNVNSKVNHNEVDQMQVDMEHVTLTEKSNAFEVKHQNFMHNTNTPASNFDKNNKKHEDWAWENRNDQFPPSFSVNTNKQQMMTDKFNFIDHKDHQSEPMCLGTPPEQIMSNENKNPLGTLETMHEMLNNSFSIIDQKFNAKNNFSEKEDKVIANTDIENLVAKVWVVRYVDYTSKYGLGFLFNTGSAGVYFNDSTKIVLSADGTVFQYIERRRRDSSSGSEHLSQTHLMSSYPPELQKKVTLLRHFRNYLIDQQKNSGHNNETGCVDNQLNDNQGLIKDELVSEGASKSIKFGSSSVKYTDNQLSSAVLENGEDECDMPFLKKWVRTKHAILFRISNKTVQVVFYDRSEVLLSSEARIITFVNKQGCRTEHSLDEVLHSGRLDIAKRLKYTKDIMYRLISTQSKQKDQS